MDFYIGSGFDSFSPPTGSVGLGGGSGASSGSGFSSHPADIYTHMLLKQQKQTATNTYNASLGLLDNPAAKYAAYLAVQNSMDTPGMVGSPEQLALLANRQASFYSAPSTVNVNNYTPPAYQGNTLGGLFTPTYTPDKYMGAGYQSTPFPGEFDPIKYESWLKTQQGLSATANEDFSNYKSQQDTAAKDFYSTAYESWLQKQMQTKQQEESGLLPQARPLDSDWKGKIDTSSLMSGLVNWLLSDKGKPMSAPTYTNPDYAGQGLLSAPSQPSQDTNPLTTAHLPWQRHSGVQDTSKPVNVRKGAETPLGTQAAKSMELENVQPQDTVDTNKLDFLDKYKYSSKRNLDLGWMPYA